MNILEIILGPRYSFSNVPPIKLKIFWCKLFKQKFFEIIIGKLVALLFE